MNNTFELKKGKLVFQDDKILIEDDILYQRRMRLFSSLFLVAFGIFNLYNYFKNNDQHFLNSALFLGIVGLVTLVLAMRVNVQKEIDLKSVKSMKVRKMLFKEIFIIRLHQGSPRQVVGIYNAERLEEYIQTLTLPNGQV
ncbi:MAG: hypothetical protein LWW85_00890 [Marinilabiliales bacterium]|nr:hypothetical protein [Marinilabiliales bacterium]